MSRIENSVVIDRPIGEVWSFLIDFDNVPTSYPGIRESKQLSDGAFEKGATIRMSGSVGPLPVTSKQEVTEFERNRLIEFRSVGSSLEGNVVTRFDLDRVDAATRLSATSEAHGMAGMLSGLVSAVRRKQRDEFFGNLKRLLEARGPAAAQDVAVPTRDAAVPAPRDGSQQPEAAAPAGALPSSEVECSVLSSSEVRDSPSGPVELAPAAQDAVVDASSPIPAAVGGGLTLDSKRTAGRLRPSRSRDRVRHSVAARRTPSV